MCGGMISKFPGKLSQEERPGHRHFFWDKNTQPSRQGAGRAQITTPYDLGFAQTKVRTGALESTAAICIHLRPSVSAFF